jgi:hypothetical protein
MSLRIANILDSRRSHGTRVYSSVSAEEAVALALAEEDAEM